MARKNFATTNESTGQEIYAGGVDRKSLTTSGSDRIFLPFTALVKPVHGRGWFLPLPSAVVVGC